MLEVSLFSLFLAGLMGGGHCLGMCGGIVAALGFRLPPGRQALILAGYNAGRVASYTLLGALAGGIAGFGLAQSGIASLQLTLYVAANLLIVAMGLYLAGLSSALTRVEALGRPVWARLQPLTRRLLPVRTLGQSLAAGALWGWVPCGLVYSAMLSALASGSAGRGALVMLAFGAGTLPNLLLMGAFADALRRLMQKRPVRLAAGLTVVGLGLWRLGLAVPALRA